MALPREQRARCWPPTSRWPANGRASWMRASNGCDRAAQRVDRQRRGDVGRARELFGAGQRQREHGGRRLRAVDERQPFLRAERDRRQAGAARAPRRPGIGRPSSPSASPSPMSTSARCASGARSPLAPTEPRDGTTRVHAAVEQREQRLERLERGCRRSPWRARWRAAPSSRARRARAAASPTPAAWLRSRLSCSASSASGAILHLGERAEPGVDAVDRRVAARLAVDDRARRVDARARASARAPTGVAAVGDGERAVRAVSDEPSRRIMASRSRILVRRAARRTTGDYRPVSTYATTTTRLRRYECRSPRRAVGRRRQGQDRRPADAALLDRGPLPGRTQRRPHGLRRAARSSSCACIPSGILHPGVTCVIGNGVVVDPQALFAEIDELAQHGHRRRRPPASSATRRT